jgi:hypothetical protein
MPTSETSCSRCKHRKICKYVDYLIKAVETAERHKKMKPTDNLCPIRMEVICEYFEENTPTPRKEAQQ